MVPVKAKKEVKSKKDRSIYLLDTNVLVHDPKALYSFDGSHVAIPVTVLEEMDRFKHEGTDRGRNSRKTIRLLDELRKHGSLKDGVSLDNGSIVQVLFPPVDQKNSLKEKGFLAGPDNDILLMALGLKDEGYTVHFISKDLNARVKGDCLGIDVQDYIKDSVSQDEFYHGWIRIQISANDLRSDNPVALKDSIEQLVENQFVLVESKNNPHNNKVFRYLGGSNFKLIQSPHLAWPLAPRNPQQLMAMNLLMDPEIQFVCLFGPAGTGKTFLALLAGLHQVLINHEYEKLLISRPVVPLGRDIGYYQGHLRKNYIVGCCQFMTILNLLLTLQKLKSRLEQWLIVRMKKVVAKTKNMI